MKISGWIKNRVCDTFTIGCMDFYIMMHDCGQVLLCEAGGRSCRLDATAIGIPKAESYMAVLKHRWEEKISLASLSPDELLQLSEHTGIRFNSPTAPTPKLLWRVTLHFLSTGLNRTDDAKHKLGEHECIPQRANLSAAALPRY